MFGVQLIAEAIWALSPVVLKNSSIYPLDNVHSQCKSLGGRKCEQYQSTCSLTLILLGGSCHMHWWWPFLINCCMKNYLLVPTHSISERNGSNTVSRNSLELCKIDGHYCKWWCVIEVRGEKSCIVDSIASKTVLISGLKQKEQPGKVVISIQVYHSLFAKSVGESVKLSV